MFRTCSFWFTLLLLAASLGYYWVLSSNLVFVRIEPPAKAATVQPK